MHSGEFFKSTDGKNAMARRKAKGAALNIRMVLKNTDKTPGVLAPKRSVAAPRKVGRVGKATPRRLGPRDSSRSLV